MKTNRKAAVALSVLFLVLAVVGFESTFAAKPLLSKNLQVVVRFECDAINSSVVSLDGSAGAPDLPPSTLCAQAIADFLDTGFRQVSAEEASADPSNVTGGETHTLIAAGGVHVSKTEHDVLRLVCQGNLLSVQDASAGAPLIASSTCSQALADALNHQFKLSSTETLVVVFPSFTAYTLIRSHEQ